MIIGLSGTNGSGKDSIGEILADKHNFLFISVTELLRNEAISRNESTEREVLRTISAEWRRESGLGVLIDKAVEEYEKQGGDSKYSGLVIASLRNPGEADRVHQLKGQVIWIDANPKIRYNRIFSRARIDDKKSYEQFIDEELTEMQHTGDEATLSMAGVKVKSDKTFINDGNDLEILETQVKEQLI